MALTWCGDACLKSICAFPQDGGEYTTVTQGLSGMRGTDFVNTKLNWVYFTIASDFLRTQLNLTTDELFHIHKGDDVWIDNKNLLWAIALYNTMRRMGFVFQSGKQLFGTDIGEFLRVLYKDGFTKGYLMRCVGTLIIKPLQASEVSDPIARVSALSSQLNVLCRRGLSKATAKVVWEAIIPYQSSFLHGGRLHQLPYEHLVTHPLRGGLGVPPPGRLPSLKNEFFGLPQLKQRHFMLLGHTTD
ncbi:Uncharacterized protein FKW44_010813 [Caligus rogercresseyi]|uniref:RNA-directed RNA polymerase n=1 Tax=Caligus rogercresseyi TaxID=217165 RepID=A0A7T8K9A7_CALRO|nr:Uncharacterized protein FKW44_010813 [Caligus rogercresseyi]